MTRARPGRIEAQVKRIMWLGFEPWETRLGIEFLNQVMQSSDVASGSLVVADVTQVEDPVFANSLRKLVRSTGFVTHLVFDLIASWQFELSRPDNVWSHDVLQEAVKTTGFDLRMAMHAEVMFTPFERRPYFKPFNDDQARHAAALICRRLTAIFDQEMPTAVYMINDQYFCKHFAAALANSRGIELYVVRHSRVQDYYKCDSQFWPIMSDGIPGQTATMDLDSVRLELRGSDEHLYWDNLAVSGGHKSFAVECRSNPGRAMWRAFLVASRRIIDSTLGDLRRRGVVGLVRRIGRNKFFVAQTWRMLVFDVSCFFRTCRHILRRKQFLQNLPSYSYILIPLHIRSEGNSQAGIVSEEQVVEVVASTLAELGSHVRCVVLENPSAIGERRTSFYRLLTNMPRVDLVDPSVETQGLIRGAEAVVTLSGTVALEASLKGVPAHAVGRPDYISAIESSGWHELPSFVRAVVDGTAAASVDAAKRYVGTVQVVGRRMQLGWTAISSKESVAAISAELILLCELSRHGRQG